MTGFFNNAKAFCEGFESALPVGKVTKFIVMKSFDFAWNTIVNDMCPPKPDFGGYTASVDRDAYNQVMNRRECECER